ncbi:MAG TPA: hypothetical protein PLJ27_26130, partial [Polyangiaceae bacterium]|nr:hypothetical protein [Polyangiaceae bacterium]
NSAGLCDEQCAALGSSCVANQDCCSNVCEQNRCVPPQCLANGEYCIDDAQCCSFRCDETYTCVP